MLQAFCCLSGLAQLAIILKNNYFKSKSLINNINGSLLIYFFISGPYFEKIFAFNVTFWPQTASILFNVSSIDVNLKYQPLVDTPFSFNCPTKFCSRSRQCCTLCLTLYKCSHFLSPFPGNVIKCLFSCHIYSLIKYIMIYMPPTRNYIYSSRTMTENCTK